MRVGKQYYITTFKKHNFAPLLKTQTVEQENLIWNSLWEDEIKNKISQIGLEIFRIVVRGS